VLVRTLDRTLRKLYRLDYGRSRPARHFSGWLASWYTGDEESELTGYGEIRYVMRRGMSWRHS
jgi:hypothetical protein